jgi:hypothetical protein
MKCRGFCGRYYPKKPRPPRPADIAFLFAASAALFTMRLFNVSLLFGRIIKL